ADAQATDLNKRLADLRVNLASEQRALTSEESRRDRLRIVATARATARTGVEMEALTAVSAAALALYDMTKAVDKTMRIEGVRLLAKIKVPQP
ncbi:MAG: hypothetical protein HUU04_00790, partial [Verrucomicrobiae bacterium]|nr:hypothetical protein [Verrucomicrobiae bacterium]